MNDNYPRHFSMTTRLRHAGWTTIAAALRHFGAKWQRALRFSGRLSCLCNSPDALGRRLPPAGLPIE